MGERRRLPGARSLDVACSVGYFTLVARLLDFLADSSFCCPTSGSRRPPLIPAGVVETGERCSSLRHTLLLSLPVGYAKRVFLGTPRELVIGGNTTTTTTQILVLCRSLSHLA